MSFVVVKSDIVHQSVITATKYLEKEKILIELQVCYNLISLPKPTWVARHVLRNRMPPTTVEEAKKSLYKERRYEVQKTSLLIECDVINNLLLKLYNLNSLCRLNDHVVLSTDDVALLENYGRISLLADNKLENNK